MNQSIVPGDLAKLDEDDKDTLQEYAERREQQRPNSTSGSDIRQSLENTPLLKHPS